MTPRGRCGESARARLGWRSAARQPVPPSLQLRASRAPRNPIDPAAEGFLQEIEGPLPGFGLEVPLERRGQRHGRGVVGRRIPRVQAVGKNQHPRQHLHRRVRIYKDDASVELIVHSGPDDYKSDCSRFLAWTTGHLGTPAKAIDMPMPAKQESWVEWTANWLFGQVRVEATCGGLMIGDTFVAALVDIVYRHHSMLKPFKILST